MKKLCTSTIQLKNNREDFIFLSNRKKANQYWMTVNSWHRIQNNVHKTEKLEILRSDLKETHLICTLEMCCEKKNPVNYVSIMSSFMLAARISIMYPYKFCQKYVLPSKGLFVWKCHSECNIT